MRATASALDDDHDVGTGLMQLSAAAEAARRMALLPTPLSSPHSAATKATSFATESQTPDMSDSDDHASEPTRVVQLITTTASPSPPGRLQENEVASSTIASAAMTTTTTTTTTTATSSYGHDRNSARSSAAALTGADVGLPPGWRRVVHESGLPCFVNEEIQIVTWTRPYTIDAVGGDFLTLAKTHVPPLSIFSRRDGGLRQSQLLARLKESEADELVLPTKATSSVVSVHDDAPNGQKKRKAEELMAAPGPSFQVKRNGASIPVVGVNGKALESPEGKSVHAFLRDFAMAAWKAVPQYTFTKPEGGEGLPIACSVRIHDNDYPSTAGPNKPVAKEAAAEAVLEHHIPGYWIELKNQGRVGKYPILPQPHPSPPTPAIKEERKSSSDEKAPTMTLEEFKMLSIGDSRVLQACMDLSIKTPAQVVQEYQNRHRGVSVNYNTIPHESDGQKLFKAIATAGNTVAEGIASTKKVAKQYAAQSLLVLLHQRSVKLYHEVAELYSRGSHGDLLGSLPLTVQTDAGSLRSSPSKKPRRSSPLHNQSTAMAYAQSGTGYNRSGGNRVWDGGYAAYDRGASSTGQPRPESNYAKKNERIVEYYSPNSGGYGAYYGNGGEWGSGYHGHAPAPAYGSYGPATYASIPVAPPAPPPLGSYAPPPPLPLPPHTGGGPVPHYAYVDPRSAPYNRPKF